jgi:mannose-6-phosphate isomerase-like protein (cupin superfamily)
MTGTEMEAQSDASTAAPFGSWRDWVRQGLIFTEAVRGGPLVWPAGGTHLHGDPLGPVRHAHDDAAEYYYILNGQCLVEVGGEERVTGAGDLVYIPANAPHNLLGEVGHTDAWVFVLVAPNLTHNKWRLSSFLPGSEQLRMTVSRPLEGDAVAATHAFPAEAVRITRGTPLASVAESGERVYLVADGRVHARAGAMAGNLGAGEYLHVRRDLEVEVSSLTEQATLLSFECSFLPFDGVELGPGASAGPG